MAANEFTVGRTVRARLPDHPKATRRAVIATLQDDSACVLWEDEAPKSLPVGNALPAKKARFLTRPFLVTPYPAKSNEHDTSQEEIESTCLLSELLDLLEFEKEQSSSDNGITAPTQVWKERGDQLLRLGDASAAIPYYEVALKLTSTLQIGSSVLVKAAGHAKVAEIDCLDEDESTIDVSFVDSGVEKSVSEKEILLCILEPDEDHLQERILLNLARCLLQLGDTSTAGSGERSKYLKSAVLACTLVLALASFHSENENDHVLTNTEKSALLLRGQAQAGLQKFPHAVADFKKLLKSDPDNKQGRKLLQKLDYQKAKLAKTDKRLAKEVSRWVQTVMNNDSSDDSVSGSGETKLIEHRPETRNTPHAPLSATIPWFTLLAAVLLAWLVQKNGQG